jgi:hypothetical protein
MGRAFLFDTFLHLGCYSLTLFAVFLDMSHGRFVGVGPRPLLVATRCVSVVSGLLVMTGLVLFCGFVVKPAAASVALSSAITAAPVRTSRLANCVIKALHSWRVLPHWLPMEG